MIAALTGRLLSKTPTHVILDVQGVGYEVHTPLSTFYALPDTQQTFHLHIYTHLREDSIQLFGFASQEEKLAFVLLTSVSGIGPKLALSVLSTLTVTDLLSAIQSGDVDKLATVPGVGKKSAGRIALELKDKAERFGATHPAPADPTSAALPQPHDDAISALVNLGYKPAEVKDVIKRLQRPERPSASLELLIKDALKELAKGAIRS
jgi:Holliday junction DNA helicase RuvA